LVNFSLQRMHGAFDDLGNRAIQLSRVRDRKNPAPTAVLV
jgi:hypothetical protein